MTGGDLSFQAYDTICRIHLPAEEGCETDAASVLAGAQALARSVERCLSMYDETSELSALCRRYAPCEPYAVSPMLFSFLQENFKIAALSGGAFDPTVGALVRLWDFLSETPDVPGAELIAEMLERVGYAHVKLCPAEGSVVFDAPNLVLDPGAGGKGFALGLVERYLRENGIQCGTLDFGGNLYAMGRKRLTNGQSRPWTVGIRDPDRPDSAMGSVTLEDRGIATSSWYEHSFKRGERIFHHLLDPKTGNPVPLTIKSVSILSSRAIYTDILSTAFFVLGLEKGAALLNRLKEQEHVDLDYVAMLEDGSIHSSAGAGFTAL